VFTPLPAPPPAAPVSLRPAARPTRRPAWINPQDEIEAFCAAVPTSTIDLPDAQLWARQFVQAAIEVAAGHRPAAQLVRWTNDDVLTLLTRRGRLAAAQRRASRHVRPAVRSVRVSYPSDGVVEASAVVWDQGRIRAVAFRMDGLDRRWRVTALEIG
jgi:hypothetical protein